MFSAALARELPRVAVSHHRALSCSDFPPAEINRRSPDPLFAFDPLSTRTMIAEVRLFFTSDIEVFFEGGIVGFGVVASKMYASTFVSLLCGVGDQ